MKPRKVTPTIIALLALVISITSTASTYLLSTQLQDSRKDTFISNAQQGYNIGKLEFCINHSIAPCDDTTIATWNDIHPDEQLLLKTYQQIIEDGIAEYETSSK